MKKLFIIELILIGIILLLGGIFFNQIKTKYNEYREMYRDISGDNYAEEDNNMNIIINDKSYKIIIEDNQTTKELLELLPLDITMNDLNNNEKYYNLDKSITSNPISYKTINKGDIMLYNDNCIVLFYKTFNTSYSYTKIGRLEDNSILDNIGNESIKVRLERE